MRTIGLDKISGWLAVALVLAVLLASTPARAISGSAYTTGNSSLFIYRGQPGGTGSSGLAVTGTLKDGIFVQQTILYPLRLYTHAAVSRDTLLLYDASSGYAETRYFIDGIYTPQKTYNLGSNWTHVVASCDSYLVYRRGASSAQTGLLQGGSLAFRQYHWNFDPNWQNISASCDTVMFQNGGIASGTLTAGYFSQKTWIPASQAGVPTGPSAPTALASTAYSYLFYGSGRL